MSNEMTGREEKEGRGGGGESETVGHSQAR